MSIEVNNDGVTVFKQRETGVAALCEEVAEFIASGEATRRGVSARDARYEEFGDALQVFFPNKGPATVTLSARDAAFAVEHLRYLTDRHPLNADEAKANSSLRWLADQIEEASQ
jgi:hypothetical protein